MAFGSSSKIFTSFVCDVMTGVLTPNLLTGHDQIKIALYGNSGTPNQAVASANAQYPIDQWISSSNGTNEVWSNPAGGAGTWPQGGLALSGLTNTADTVNPYAFSATNQSGSNSDTITNAFGCLIYDNTLGSAGHRPAICYLSFGGSPNTVTGTFTVAFNVAGIFTVTV